MKNNSLENSITAFGITLGACSYIIYAGGLLRFLRQSAVISGLLLGLGIAYAIYLACAFFIEAKPLNKPAVIAIAALASVYFLAIFSPIIEIDSLAYHLYLPKIFLKHNLIYFDNYNGNTLFPLLLENLFCVGLNAGSVTLCNAIVYAVGAFLILTVIAFLYYLFDDKKYILPGVFIMLSMPGIITNSVISYNDTTMSLFIILSLYFFIRWKKTAKNSHFYLMGIFSGLSISTKHLGLFVVLILSALMVYAPLRKKCLYLLTVFLTGGWWYLRAYALTGNPFYPYLYKIFGPKAWQSNVSSSVGMGKGLWQYLIGFWNLIAHPGKFGGGANQIGVIFLLLIPILIFAWKKFSKDEKSALGRFLGFSFLYYTMWFFTAQNLRFFYPIVVILCVILAVAVIKVQSKIITALFTALLVLNFTLTFYYQGKKIKAALFTDKQALLSNADRTYDIAQWVNSHIPQKEKILICDEPGIYRFNPSVTKEAIFRYITQYEKKNFSAAELRDFLKKSGFSYIIMRKWLDNNTVPRSVFLKGTVPDFILQNNFPYAKFLYATKFTDPKIGVFEYYVYKIG